MIWSVTRFLCDMTSVSLSRCYAWTFQPDGEERVNNERQSDHSVSERSVGYGVNHTYLQWLTGCRPGSWVLSLTSSDRRWRWRRRTEAERGYRVEIMSPSVPTLQQQQQRRSRHVIIAIITRWSYWPQRPIPDGQRTIWLYREWVAQSLSLLWGRVYCISLWSRYLFVFF